MAVLDDITLLRYSEDDLSPHEKREVEELLTSNADAQKKLEMLIRSSKVLESALGHLKEAKPPESIVKMVRESSAIAPIAADKISTTSDHRQLAGLADKISTTSDLREAALLHAAARPGSTPDYTRNSSFISGKTTWLSIAASLVLGVGIGGLSINYLKSESPIQIALIDEPAGQTSGDVITGDSQNLKFRGLRQGFDRLKTGPTVSMFGPAVIKVLFDGNPDGKELQFATKKGRKFVVQIEQTLTAVDGSECRSAVASEITAVKSPKLGIMACRKGGASWEAASTYFNERE